MRNYIDTNVRLGDYDLKVIWDYDLYSRCFVFVLFEDKPKGLKLLWRIEHDRVYDYAIDMKQGRAMQYAFTDIDAAGGFGRLATTHLPGEELREGNIAAAVAAEREACAKTVETFCYSEDADYYESPIRQYSRIVKGLSVAIRARGKTEDVSDALDEK